LRSNPIYTTTVGYVNVTDGQTDRLTDRRTYSIGVAILRYAQLVSRRKTSLTLF